MYSPSILGTSYDLRGVYGRDIDDEFFYRLGRALALFFTTDQRAVVGRDARVSSPTLSDALIRGLLDGGRSVVDIGLVSSDMLTFATM